MTQAMRRRAPSIKNQRAGSNVLTLIVIALVMMATFYYGWRVLSTGDWLWFSSQFDARPTRIAIIDRGRRIEIGPTDPRFTPLMTALNESISKGYRNTSVGFSEQTWQVVDQNGLLVEAQYAQPVALRGGFLPTDRLLLLVDGKNIHMTQVLFRRDAQTWSSNPVAVNDIEPMRRVLAQQGFLPQPQ